MHANVNIMSITMYIHCIIATVLPLAHVTHPHSTLLCKKTLHTASSWGGVVETLSLPLCKALITTLGTQHVLTTV